METSLSPQQSPHTMSALAPSSAISIFELTSCPQHTHSSKIAHTKYPFPDKQDL